MAAGDKIETLILANVVYESWFAHEQRMAANVMVDARRWFLCEELPRRAEWPQVWYQCTLEPACGLEFLVGQGWAGWTDWSLPEGTYRRVAQRIINADPAIPSQTIERIKALAAALILENSPLFARDPLILRGDSRDGPFKVVEGHHRVSAISVATLEGRSLRPFVAFVGIGPYPSAL